VEAKKLRAAVAMLCKKQNQKYELGAYVGKGQTEWQGATITEAG